MNANTEQYPYSPRCQLDVQQYTYRIVPNPRLHEMLL